MAYRNDHLFNYCSSLFPCHQQFGGEETNQDDFHEFIDQALYESDEFRMYAYKIKRCSNLRSHDWTSCPFTHRGEKARRRDPREYNYLPIPCPGYKFASCVKGDNCELCHGVFEYWLHPAKYRTHPCHAGTLCDRRVCFFAHTLEELRPETNYNWCYVYQYPLHIQPYPDILIEDIPKGIWIVIPCNYQLSPLPPSHDQYYGTIVSEPENSFTSQQISPISSYQSQPKIDLQNESDFSLFSTSHSKLIEDMKNLEIGSTSHAKVNIMDDEKGKKSVEFEFESEDQEFQNFNWVTDLLMDEFEDTSL
ncbi:zinc finger CCCH domain-containing protein 24-like [Solanum tuberosum]|uniref:Zinc finger CCCH domain-containing protein 54 n=1 Tax=Solanum tuberosum TaxID=4113 RepID=M1E0U9_SOLTU|nr:PREDICTED: zinc finger CCCH domain-containing protein 24-like [Solanum tuberosum]